MEVSLHFRCFKNFFELFFKDIFAVFKSQEFARSEIVFYILCCTLCGFFCEFGIFCCFVTDSAGYCRLSDWLTLKFRLDDAQRQHADDPASIRHAREFCPATGYLHVPSDDTASPGFRTDHPHPPDTDNADGRIHPTWRSVIFRRFF